MTNNQLTDERIAEIKDALSKTIYLYPTHATGTDVPATDIVAALEELQERRKSSPATAAASDVLAERQRQMAVEGWTPEGDDDHTDGELPRAASCYALMSWREECLSDGEYTASQKAIPHHWPWDPAWWKPTDPRRDLVKAGALILAEIERLDRERSKSCE